MFCRENKQRVLKRKAQGAKWQSGDFILRPSQEAPGTPSPSLI